MADPEGLNEQEQETLHVSMDDYDDDFEEKHETRAVSMGQMAAPGLGNHISDQPKKSPPKDGPLKMPMSAAGICSLPLKGNLPEIVNAIHNHLDEQKIGFSKPRKSEFVGYLFEQAAYAFFQLVVFMRTKEDLPGLKLRKLDGDTYLSADMFFKVREMLKANGMLDTENDQWSAMDEDTEIDENLANLSDTEDDGEQKGEEPSKYLELEHDVGVVAHWVQELEEGNADDEKLNAALLMGHNSENEKNALIMDQHSDGKLVPALTKVMNTEKNSLAMVRACLRTLHNLLMLVENLNVGMDEIRTVLNTLLTWNKQNASFSYSRPVPNSKEVQKLAADSLDRLMDKVEGQNIPEDVQGMFDEVRVWLESDGVDIEAKTTLENIMNNKLQQN
jgi:hypothetical protein